MTTFEDIQALAAERGIEVQLVPGFPRFYRLVTPSRINPGRVMPPLLMTTAEIAAIATPAETKRVAKPKAKEKRR